MFGNPPQLKSVPASAAPIALLLPSLPSTTTPSLFILHEVLACQWRVGSFDSWRNIYAGESRWQFLNPQKGAGFMKAVFASG